MPHNEVIKKVVSGFAWEGMAKVIVQILSWISTIYVARVLNPDDYGLVAISGVFVGLCLLIGGLGLSAGIIQKKEVSKEEKDGVFWVSLIINFTLLGSLYLAAPWVALLYELPLLEDIIRVAAFILVLSSLSLVPHAEKVRALDFRFTAVSRM